LDRGLVRECLDGRREAYGTLVGRYEKLMYNIALRMSGDRDDARDIVQSAFVKAYRKLDTFDPRYRFFSWIYRIVINEALNLIDRRKRLTPVESDLPWPHRNPEEDFGSSELAERVQEAITLLSPDYRQVVLLRHYADLSYRDIGETLGIPEKTVKSRLFTARRLLEEILTRKGVVRT
jgi:RNA polymerase sigma-70 factor (ECF subfamily)